MIPVAPKASNLHKLSRPKITNMTIRLTQENATITKTAKLVTITTFGRKARAKISAKTRRKEAK